MGLQSIIKMAASLFRTTSSLVRKTLTQSLSVTSVRCAGGPPAKPVDQHKGKYASDEVSMAAGLGHAVGIDRIEQLAHEMGDDDPFEMKPIKKAAGTFDEPTTVGSQFEKRLIGCVCEPDSLSMVWLTVYKGEPKRCKCVPLVQGGGRSAQAIWTIDFPFFFSNKFFTPRKQLRFYSYFLKMLQGL